MDKTFINAVEVKPFVRGAHAVKVGNTIHISGMPPMDRKGNVIGKGDIETQATRSFESMKAVLETAGASFSDVIYITAYLKDISHYAKYQEVRSRYIKDYRFAGMTMSIVDLPAPDMLLEITAIAVID